VNTEQLIGTYVPTVGAAGVLAGLLIAGFKWANQSLATDIREGVSLWLLGAPSQPRASLIAARAFNAVYGANYFSRRAFVVNLAIAAMATVASAVALLLARWPMESHVWLSLGSLWLIYLLPILCFCYIKARWFSARLSQSITASRAALLLVADFMSSALIWVGWLTVLFLLPPGDNALKSPLYLLTFASNVAQSVFVGSLIPSLLVTLVAAAILARRLYLRVSPILGRVSPFLSKERIEKEPLTLIGEVFAAVVFVLVCTYGLVLRAAA
jgi:hypothetical protein